MSNNTANQQAEAAYNYLTMRRQIKKAAIAAFEEKNGDRATWIKKQKKEQAKGK